MTTETATANETESITIYTTAPVEYDGFSTHTVDENAGANKNSGKIYRRVQMENRDHQWQTHRYGSGMHVALGPDQFSDWVKCGLIIPPTAPQPEPTAEERLEAVAGAALALISATGEVNRGIWQVPHASMQGLMRALTDAGIDF